MKVLIIEDDSNKLDALKNLLEDYKKIGVETRGSYHSGVREILREKYDLILLDMSMPVYDITIQDNGGRPLPLAGRDILFTMHRRKIATKVIVTTQYESFEGISLKQLDEDLYAAFPELYCGAIYYNTTQNVWREELQEKLYELFNMKGELA